MLNRKKGFSLVEVVLALGIVAFAVVAIMGMFPVALGTAKDGLSETHAAMIAQMIMGQIRAQSAAGATFAVGPDPTTTAGSYAVSLKTSQTAYAIYDENGLPVARISQAQFNTPSGLSTSQKAQCAYQVRLTIDPDKPAVGASQLTIEVGYPGLAPVASRKTSTFVAVAKNSDS